eukprot:scaffold22748_cov182-Cylindrotheca_fusiformis.AAC.10
MKKTHVLFLTSLSKTSPSGFPYFFHRASIPAIHFPNRKSLMAEKNRDTPELFPSIRAASSRANQ